MKISSIALLTGLISMVAGSAYAEDNIRISSVKRFADTVFEMAGINMVIKPLYWPTVLIPEQGN